MNLREVWRVALAIGLIAIGTKASGHHAPTEYDFDKSVEIEGTIVELRWQNPHVTLKVRDSKDSSKV